MWAKRAWLVPSNEPWPTVVKTLSTSGTAMSCASTWLVAALVAASGVPAGISMVISTWPMSSAGNASVDSSPSWGSDRPPTNEATASTTTSQRKRNEPLSTRAYARSSPA